MHAGPVGVADLDWFEADAAQAVGHAGFPESRRFEEEGQGEIAMKAVVVASRQRQTHDFFSSLLVSRLGDSFTKSFQIRQDALGRAVHRNGVEERL